MSGVGARLLAAGRSSYLSGHASDVLAATPVATRIIPGDDTTGAVDEMTVTRWNPQARAGAVGIRARKGVDAKAMQQLAQTVSDWAKYQSLSGEPDTIEASTFQGTYDWRAYLQEEAHIAQRREAAKQPRDKKPAAPAPAAAPSVFYA